MDTKFNACQIYLLPSSDKISVIGRYKDSGNYVYNDFIKDIPRGESYHIYITSNDKIKAGDWYIHKQRTIKQKNVDLRILLCVSDYLPMDAKKIIATTDKSLDFECNECKKLKDKNSIYTCSCYVYPKPSKDYINDFLDELNLMNEPTTGFIKEVLVKYVDINSGWKLLAKQSHIGDTLISENWIPYTDSVNEIYIKDL